VIPASDPNTRRWYTLRISCSVLGVWIKLARSSFKIAAYSDLAPVRVFSSWPDLAVGAGIMLLNADAAREIFEAAREEHKDAEAG
jgi:hypothetical protein